METHHQNNHEIRSVLTGGGFPDRRKLPDVQNGYRELVMAQVIFRHGARHSMSEHLLEEKEHKIKASNKGQLSEVGMRQLYLLGQSVRKEYVTDMKLLGETYDRTEIHIQSSNRTRALESAQCFMFGLYPLGTGKSIPAHIDANLTQPPNTSSRKQSLDKTNDKQPGSTELKPISSKKSSQDIKSQFFMSGEQKQMQEQLTLDDEGQSTQYSSPREEPLAGLEPEVQNFLRRGSKEDLSHALSNPPNIINEDKEIKNNYSLPEGLYPFPIQTYGDHDQLLNPHIPNKSNIISTQLKMNEKKIQYQIQKYTDDIADVAQKLHLKPQSNNNILSIKKLYDIITCQKYLGHDYGVTDQEYKLLMYLKSHNRLLELYTPNYSWTVASPLLEFFFDNFEKTLNGKAHHKLVIASTHDSQIVPLLVVLGLISPEGLKQDYENGECNFERYPPFAANFAIELYRVHSYDPMIQPKLEISIKYNGNYITLNGEQTLCANYESFRDYISGKIISDKGYKKFCGVEKRSLTKANKLLKKEKYKMKKRKLKSQLTKTNMFLTGLVIAQGICIFALYKLYKNKTV